MDWGGGGWAAMAVIMVVVWVGLAAVLVWLISNANRGRDAGSSSKPQRPTAREILDERFARGELSDEEYRSRRDALAGRP